jgi:large subunit ribosomal protein L21
MFAIIRSGGKQYKVQPGDVIRVEKLEQALGSEFDVTDVLMVGGDTAIVGAPLVDNAKVTMVVTKQTRDRKVIIFKKKRRQGYRRFKTHRQPFTELFVKAIAHAGKSAKADAAANVVDIEQNRKDRLVQKTEDRIARNTPGAVKDTEPKAKKASVKKAAPKKAAKKTGTAKKKAATKKTAKKK